MSMEGTHPLLTLYNAMQCSVRRAPGNRGHTTFPPCTMPCSAVSGGHQVTCQWRGHTTFPPCTMPCSAVSGGHQVTCRWRGHTPFPPCTMPCSAVSGGHQVTCRWRGHTTFPPCTMPCSAVSGGHQVTCQWWRHITFPLCTMPCSGCLFSYLKPISSLSQPTCKSLTHINGYTILTLSGFDVHLHLLHCCFLSPIQKFPYQILP